MDSFELGVCQILDETRTIPLEERTPVLCLHGAIENARVYYSDSRKGLGPFLARAGYAVYAADFRGRGLSRPRIREEGRGARHGQYETINRDLPALSQALAERHPARKQVWVAHSWGGVNALSALARHPELRCRVSAVVFFGTKRAIRVWHWDRVKQITFFWNFLARGLAWAVGYLPAYRLGIGGDDETRASIAQTVDWIRGAPWVDPVDGFDYGARLLEARDLPPMLFLTGSRDRTLGHPEDVRRTMAELGPHARAVFRLVEGFGHVDLLTSPEAPRKVFEGVLDWLREVSAAR